MERNTASGILTEKLLPRKGRITMDRIREKHESFGILQISRVSCNPAMNVFGSSIKTGNPIKLTIMRGEKVGDLGQNWYFPREELIEVYMSSAQFADAITTLNHGSGTPVTLTRIGCEKMEECPDVDQRQIFHAEFEKDMKNVAADLKSLLNAAKVILGKGGKTNTENKNNLIKRIEKVEQDIRANMPFVHKQFNRAMDRTVSESKAEIEGFLTETIEKLGKEALEQKKHVLEIE